MARKHRQTGTFPQQEPEPEIVGCYLGLERREVGGVNQWRATVHLPGQKPEYGEWYSERRWANADLAVAKKQWSSSVVGDIRNAV